MRSAFKEDLYNLECTEQIRLARSTKDKWQFSHAEAKWKKVQKRMRRESQNASATLESVCDHYGCHF